MHSFDRELTGDDSAAMNVHKEEIDERIKLILELEDPEVVLDLRALNIGHKSQYGVSEKSFLKNSSR